MDWSRPADLEAQVHRLWDRGRLLVEAKDGGAEFPLALRLRRPDSGAMSDRFDDVRRWIRTLEEGCKARRGFGYDLEWAEIDHRRLGRNRVPIRAFVPTREDAIRLVAKQRQADRFQQLAAATRKACPELEAWIARKPMAVLEHAADWEQVLAVLLWFRAHPRPGIYLRQLDVPNVDSKFIETRKALLIELLDLALGPDAIDASAKRHFEARYGLRSKPPLVRFRILDRQHAIDGFSDLTVPASQFAEWRSDVRRIFITENEINGLAFPDLPDAAVVFGLGYALELLAEVRWLSDKEVHYWGDIDTHGFAMLDRLRARLPAARSLLMDRETLMHHRTMWVREAAPHTGSLQRLSAEESELFEDLSRDRLGDHVRLEQERISFAWVTRALQRLGR